MQRARHGPRRRAGTETALYSLTAGTNNGAKARHETHFTDAQ